MRELLLSTALLAPLLALAQSTPPTPPVAASSAAAQCTKPTLGSRDLYLRGSMNNWNPAEAQRLYWACDHYELIVTLEGDQSFKIGDEDWSADADFGGTADRLQLKGNAIAQRFVAGPHKLVLRLDGQQGALEIGACPAAPQPCSIYKPEESPATSVTDPIALSLRFDSRLPAFKKPFGAQIENSVVDFQLSALPGVTKAELVIEKRRLEGDQTLLEYTPVARVPLTKVKAAQGRETWQGRHRFGAPAVYGYYFVVTIAGQRYVYQNNKDSIYWTKEKGSMGLGLVDEMPASPKRIRRYRQTISAADFTVPAWARDVVYYYIFPERFRNGDKANDPKPGRDKYQDQGVEFHTRWMDRPYKPNSGDGSDAAYNNDFFGGDLAGIIQKLDYIQSLGANTLYLTPIFQAASNHKYDAGDFKRVDPGFGTNADFERLTREAGKRGIRVIPDTSLNHVGSDSPYFNRFNNFPSGGAFDGGKLNPSSPYASWFKLDPTKAKPEDQYQGWLGVKDLPEIDKSSKSFRAFAYGDKDSVTKLWLDRGAAGWRMDVAPWVPDDFWREWRKAVKGHKPDALTVAETWFDASKYLLGDSFDSTMNYIFRNAVLDYAAGARADRVYQNLELLREAYPQQSLFALMNLLSSHDQARALHHFGYRDDGNETALANAKKRLRLAMFFQMTYPGSPTIYYGDEVGVAGGDDPYNRAPYPWADEGGQPDEALLADVKRLTALRNSQKVLRHGTLDAPLLLDEHVIVLLRQDGTRNAIVATNNATEPRRIQVPLPPALGKTVFTDALDGGNFNPTKDGKLEIELPGLSGRVMLSQ